MKEGRETAADERKESKAEQARERKLGIEKPIKARKF